MRRLRTLLYIGGGAAAIGAAAFGARVAAQPTGPDTRDPDAIAALDKMGAYLRTLKAFQVHAVVTTEDVMDDGEKVQTMNVSDLLADKPNRLRVEIENEDQDRLLYYDGKTFALWAPRTKFYATVAASGTIAELVNRLDDDFDIQMPFVDLFRWGTPEGDTKEITDATDLGPSVVNGVTCEQYAFRQEGLDWQVWIQNGDYPLPLRLVLTTTTDDARPQHTSEYTWNLAPSFNDQAFAFTAPADAKRISIEEVKKRQEAKK